MGKHLPGDLMNCFSSQENRTPHITKLPPMKVIWMLQKIYEAPDTILLAALLCTFSWTHYRRYWLTIAKKHRRGCVFVSGTTSPHWWLVKGICSFVWMHKSQNVFLPKENSVNYIWQNLRMGSIQTVNSSVTVSLFVIVTFYWGKWNQWEI